MHCLKWLSVCVHWLEIYRKINGFRMSQLPTVVVAMSGGVDSSVAAALLVEQGYPVVGIMLRLWSEPGMESENRCCTPDDMAVARRVAARLDIPFYAIDAREYFRKEVVEGFIEGYRAGWTPNPCVRCNQNVRWGFLLNQAKTMGAEYLATGHYARLERDEDGTTRLLRGIDESKDQSYVMSVLNQQQLAHTLFPLGDYRKEQVRELASCHHLAAAQKADSQDLCFLGSQDYRQFLIRNAPDVVQPGLIVNRSGETVGEHQGLAFYTIGQRKGLGIASPEPLYVLEKNTGQNTLVVGGKDDLGNTELIATGFNWISGKVPAQPVRTQVKIRYKAALAEATIHPGDKNEVSIRFDRPLRDITPGQRAVAYDGDVVLGGGMIISVSDKSHA
jgi:tRNA-uridine 2-sulfurtransferase